MRAPTIASATNTRGGYGSRAQRGNRRQGRTNEDTKTISHDQRRSSLFVSHYMITRQSKYHHGHSVQSNKRRGADAYTAV